MSATIMNAAAVLSSLFLNPVPTIATAAAIPVLVFVISFVHGVYDGRENPWRSIYAIAVHLTTAAAIGSVALVVYHIISDGSPVEPAMPWVPLSAIWVGWLLTLLLVKRAVDFSLIPSVRNPLLPVLSWLLALAAGAVVDGLGLTFLPGPAWLDPTVAIVTAFIIVRVILSTLRRARR